MEEQKQNQKEKNKQNKLYYGIAILLAVIVIAGIAIWYFTANNQTENDTELAYTELIKKIDAGDSSIDPYVEFANKYPVRDSLRMMRLLYRLSIGAQENKQEQLLVFSKSVSSLQNKAREQKYAKRLNVMEKKTLAMLMVTGGGTMLVLFIAMMMMMMEM